ncbi:MAG: DUF1501 domain-containing protein [Planctomycetota bacterium]|nr:DUF1501 domain-containing protein [Planctomycetota bacterium]MDA0921183.1 DUF1501 domain-containing protein [Planctomycetota bacterium]
MSHCRNFVAPPLSRREMLSQCANGFGAVALAAMMADGERVANAAADSEGISVIQGTHFEPKVRNVIFLYMDGGVSQVDTFDPKPELDRQNGKPFPSKIEKTQFNNIGNSLASPWKFKNYGESGTPVSDLFPHVGQRVDDLAVIRSMVSQFPEHTNANYFLHTGHGQQGRPSMGSWVGYGLGSECQELPGFVILNSGLIPPGGLDNFNSGFLPASYQGSVFAAQDPPVSNIRRTEKTAELQQRKLALMKRLDGRVLERYGKADKLESAIANYELAARMQTAVPDLMDVASETKQTIKAYGLEDEFKNTQTFGRSCLIARRLVERGVRFIELTCPGGNGDRWDQHGGLVDGHSKNAKSVDKPIAALLADLKQRGLFESTLVIWSGEFGRTPFAQGANGRDHNPYGFSIWMAGGGVKGGVTYGATDEFGYKVVENRVEIHDLHATMLHLLGVDHTKLTYRFSGRDMRLTDVHGHVIDGILA